MAKNNNEPKKYPQRPSSTLRDKQEQQIARAEGKVPEERRGRCEAISKSTGKPCRRWAMRNGRCSLHGGKEGANAVAASRAAQARARHPWLNGRGLFCEGVFPDEVDLYESVGVGTLEEEIRLLKVQLRRAVAAQLRWTMSLEELNKHLDEMENLKTTPEALLQHIEPDTFERKETESRTGEITEERKLVRRRRNYQQEIAFLVKTIADLEVKHADLTRRSQLGSPEMVNVLAFKLREFEEASAATMPADPAKVTEGLVASAQMSARDLQAYEENKKVAEYEVHESDDEEDEC